jgi:hypothetical protein
MTGHDQDPLDRALGELFAADQAPPRLTAAVLRMIEEARWRRERFLGRVYYGGLLGCGALALSALLFVPAPSVGIGIPIVVAAVGLTLATTWRRLVPQF